MAVLRTDLPHAARDDVQAQPVVEALQKADESQLTPYPGL